jgi:hypothetical protein
MSSNKTPFELRFDIFNEAKGSLVEQYNSEREDALSRHQIETDAGNKPEFPELPSYPSFSEIRDMAQRINKFVSDGK